jgi:hypothetical protein
LKGQHQLCSKIHVVCDELHVSQWQENVVTKTGPTQAACRNMYGITGSYESSPSCCCWSHLDCKRHTSAKHHHWLTPALSGPTLGCSQHCAAAAPCSLLMQATIGRHETAAGSHWTPHEGAKLPPPHTCYCCCRRSPAAAGGGHLLSGRPLCCDAKHAPTPAAGAQLKHASTHRSSTCAPDHARHGTCTTERQPLHKHACLMHVKHNSQGVHTKHTTLTHCTSLTTSLCVSVLPAQLSICSRGPCWHSPRHTLEGQACIEACLLKAHGPSPTCYEQQPHNRHCIHYMHTRHLNKP